MRQNRQPWKKIVRRWTVVLAVIGVVGLGAAAAGPFAASEQDTAPQQDAAQQGGTPAPFVVPTLGPTPTPVCAGLQRNRLILYERGQVTEDDPSPLNVRNGPSTTFDVIGQMPSGSVFFVLAGPECSQNYVWYRIHYRGLEGWIAEGTASQYFVDVYLPG